MHIAKTAGSYLNALFQAALGDNAVVTHIEGKIGSAQELSKTLERGVSVISGHVMHGLWQDIASPLQRDFVKVTIVRDPIEHLASHILWLDHYNLPEKRRQYHALDEMHQRIVDRVGSLNLEDVAQLDGFLTTLTAPETRLFDNCQSRYFISSGRRTLDAMRPLSLADCRALRRTVAEFDVVALQHRMEDGVARIAAQTSIPLRHTDIRVNVAKSQRRIATDNPLFRQVLGKRLIVDNWLWRMLNNHE